MEEKILQAIEGLKTQITGLTEKVDKQGTQITGLTEKVDKQGTQITGLTEKVDKQGTQLTALTEKVDLQGSQLKENTQILKALEHLAQVNKAEHDKMSFNIAELSGEINAMRIGLANVELVTANNWSDIVKLKSLRG